MSYKFKVQLRKNPITHELKYHATKAGGESMTTTTRAIRAVEKTSTVSSADVKAVLDALTGYIIEELREGRSVKLDGLGTFSTSISGVPCGSAEEATAKTIRRVRVQFRPSSEVYDAMRLDAITFERVEEEGEKA